MLALRHKHLVEPAFDIPCPQSEEVLRRQERHEKHRGGDDSGNRDIADGLKADVQSLMATLITDINDTRVLLAIIDGSGLHSGIAFGTASTLCVVIGISKELRA